MSFCEAKVKLEMKTESSSIIIDLFKNDFFIDYNIFTPVFLILCTIGSSPSLKSSTVKP